MARGRKPSVNYWQRKGGGYFATIDGEQVELALGPEDFPNGPTYKKALEEFGKHMALRINQGTNKYLVSAMFNQYRPVYLERNGNDMLSRFETMAKPFSDRHGEKSIGELRGHHFTDWLREMTTWNCTTKRHAGKLVMAAINWAVREGHIESNPILGKVRLPEARVRGEEARMSEELCSLLIKHARTEQLRQLLLALRLTGARPSEIWQAEAFNYQPGSPGRLVYLARPNRGYVWKNAKKSKKDRVVCLTPELDGIIKGLVAKHPTGKLFRTPRGKASWSRANICQHWSRLLATPEIATYIKEHNINPDHITPYCFRHTWISEWCESGRSIKICAELCGTSAAMIERVYGHLDGSKLHAFYLDFMSKT